MSVNKPTAISQQLSPFSVNCYYAATAPLDLIVLFHSQKPGRNSFLDPHQPAGLYAIRNKSSRVVLEGKPGNKYFPAHRRENKKDSVQRKRRKSLRCLWSVYRNLPAQFL